MKKTLATSVSISFAGLIRAHEEEGLGTTVPETAGTTHASTAEETAGTASATTGGSGSSTTTVDMDHISELPNPPQNWHLSMEGKTPRLPDDGKWRATQVRPVGGADFDNRDPQLPLSGGESATKVCGTSPGGENPNADPYDRGASGAFQVAGSNYELYAEVYCSNIESGRKWWNSHSCSVYARAYLRRQLPGNLAGNYTGIVDQNVSARSNVMRCDIVCDENTGDFHSPDGSERTAPDINLGDEPDLGNPAMLGDHPYNSRWRDLSLDNETYRIRVILTGAGANFDCTTTLPDYPNQLYGGMKVHVRQVKCQFWLEKVSSGTDVAFGEFREELMFIFTTKNLFDTKTVVPS